MQTFACGKGCLMCLLPSWAAADAIIPWCNMDCNSLQSCFLPPAYLCCTCIHTCRAERWALYFQVTLVERAMRRTGSAVPASHATSADGSAPHDAPGLTTRVSASGAAANGQLAHGSAADYPMNMHLAWALPPMAAVLRITHELAAADTAGMLGPLTVRVHPHFALVALPHLSVYKVYKLGSDASAKASNACVCTRVCN